jgi:hypothetical protein
MARALTASWRDDVSGLPCLAIRFRQFIFRRGFYWCGYVSLPEGHPYCGLEETTEAPLTLLPAPGGISYAGPGDYLRPHGHWWLGFDCPPEAFAPADGALEARPDAPGYVRDACAVLARALTRQRPSAPSASPMAAPFSDSVGRRIA